MKKILLIFTMQFLSGCYANYLLEDEYESLKGANINQLVQVLLDNGYSPCGKSTDNEVCILSTNGYRYSLFEKGENSVIISCNAHISRKEECATELNDIKLIIEKNTDYIHGCAQEITTWIQKVKGGSCE